MRSLRTIILLAACLATAGCAATMARTKAGPVTINEELTVTLEEAWNQFVPGAQARLPGPPGAHQIWTVDGIPIDLLAFFVGVRDGERIDQQPADPGKPQLVFHEAMSPHELVALYEALVTQGGATFQLTRLAPTNFGGASGFRFEYLAHRRADGLPMAGIGYASVVNGRLYLIAYAAPKSYFFARHLARVEAVASSARISAKPRERGITAANAEQGQASRIQKPPGYFDRAPDSGGNIKFQSQGPGGPERGVYQNPMECGGRMCR
jgi:hypothetical protein